MIKGYAKRKIDKKGRVFVNRTLRCDRGYVINLIKSDESYVIVCPIENRAELDAKFLSMDLTNEERLAYFSAKSRKLDDQNRITLPKEFCEELGIRKGGLVELLGNGDCFFIKKKA